MLEIIATISGFLCVLLIIRQNIWNWPVGLIQVALYAYIFYDAKLYSDSILQVIWFPMQFYGWWKWYRGVENKPLPVTRLSKSENLFWWIGAIVSSVGVGYVMDVYTQAAAPYVDSLILSLSLVANYLLTKKKINNWYMWIVVDIMSVCLFTYKELYFTAGLYVVYIVMVIIGYIQWKKDMDKCQPQSV